MLPGLLRRSLFALLLRAETAFGQFIGGKLAHAVIGTDLIKEALIGDFVFGDVIAAIAKLIYDLCLSVSQNIRVLLENLDDLLG